MPAAELTITAANIIAVDGYTFDDMVTAEAITQGAVVYKNASNLAALAQCDGTAAEATVVGIALNSALTGQPIRIIKGGSLGFGAILTAGTAYVLGTTYGKIMASSELVATNKVTYLGIASTTSNLIMSINNTGVTKA